MTVRAAYAKTVQARTIPINSLVREAHERLPRRSEWLFAKPNGKSYHAVAAGLTQDVVLHTLPHTFATRLIENGVDLWTVQELGGWSNLKMLERYGHVRPSRKAEAVGGLVRISPTLATTPRMLKLVSV